MTKKELVAAKAVELQKALAEYMREEMLDNSEYVGNMYYVCDGVNVFSDGDMIVKTTLPELKGELVRLEIAKALKESEQVRCKIDKLTAQAEAIKQEMKGGAQ